MAARNTGADPRGCRARSASVCGSGSGKRGAASVLGERGASAGAASSAGGDGTATAPPSPLAACRTRTRFPYTLDGVALASPTERYSRLSRFRIARAEAGEAAGIVEAFWAGSGWRTPVMSTGCWSCSGGSARWPRRKRARDAPPPRRAPRDRARRRLAPERNNRGVMQHHPRLSSLVKRRLRSYLLKVAAKMPSSRGSHASSASHAKKVAGDAASPVTFFARRHVRRSSAPGEREAAPRLAS